MFYIGQLEQSIKAWFLIFLKGLDNYANHKASYNQPCPRPYQARIGIKCNVSDCPPEMNGNPDYSWYEMLFGNLKIEVYTTSDDHFSCCEMVTLSVTHGNSSYGVTEYFYSDTMEYASEYTEMKRRENICDIIGDEDDLTYKRLRREASDAVWHHFNECKKHEPLADSLSTAQIEQNLQNDLPIKDIEAGLEMNL